MLISNDLGVPYNENFLTNRVPQSFQARPCTEELVAVCTIHQYDYYTHPMKPTKTETSVW